jgi:hypothetical protein
MLRSTTLVFTAALGVYAAGAGQDGAPQGGSPTADSATEVVAPDDAQAPLFERRDLVVNGEVVRTRCGSADKDYIVEVNGGGIVLGDFDRSGSVDIVVISGSSIAEVEANQPGDAPRLFLNDGAANFSAAPEAWNMAPGRWGMGGTAGDVDGDGDLDLVVTQWGPTRLFVNQEGRGFVEKTDAGFSGSRWGTSAAFLDYDDDGHLDLVVVNYLAFRRDEIESRTSGACKWKGLPVMCGPEGLTAVHDQLFRGRGDGTFEDVTAAAGFRPEAAAFGLGVTTVDYDLDGDTDVYVTNDSTPNHLWENQGDGTFVEVGFRRGVDLDANGKEQAGMGIAVGDIDEDGLQDLFVTNFSGEANAFYQSRASKSGSSPRFSDRSHAVGLGGPSLQMLGWGTGAIDADLDGDLDLYVMNGHVYPQADAPGTDTRYAQPDQLYVNESGRFVVRTLAGGPDLVSRSAAHADLDGDGDLDIVGTQVDGAVQVFVNRTAPGRWIAFDVEAVGGNRDGLGAIVEIVAGDRKRRAEIRTSGGFQAGLPPTVHFGLGALESVDLVRVALPDRRIVEVESPPIGRLTTIAVPAQEEQR